MATRTVRTSPALTRTRASASAFKRIATYGDPRSENALFRGDNADVLSAYRDAWKERFRLIYFDPPYNTGRTFAEYIDRTDPRAWADMIRARLTLLYPLLREDGALVAQIGDTEFASLHVLLDEVFGRDNRISTITLVRSAATGHKAKNAGPVNVSDFLLLYAKSRKHFRPRALTVPREGTDPAYSTFLHNRSAPTSRWKFGSLREAAATHLGYESASSAKRTLGREAFEANVTAFALAHADSVIRFAQPRYEAVSKAARTLIDRSRQSPERVLTLARASHPDLILRGGNRILFLSDKIEQREGQTTVVEPMTNVWSDIPYQGIAKEGGVVFSRNKKPEALLARILEMASEPGSWVLDPFAGSGTTCAAAHKMGRTWVGIEKGSHLDNLCIPRLRRVVDGVDETGVSRSTGFSGGGGFSVYG